jgi:AraC-like DNA-binding protein
MLTTPRHDQTTRLPGAPWALIDAANHLGISVRHLHRLIEAQKVQSFKLGRRRMLADREVQRIACEGVR